MELSHNSGHLKAVYKESKVVVQLQFKSKSENIFVTLRVHYTITTKITLLCLKQQITYMSHSDACAEADLSCGLDSVKFGQDASSVWCQCGEDLTVTT